MSANLQISPETAKSYIDYAQSVIVSKTYDYEGNPVTFNKGDNVMVSATDMARPFNKMPKDWLKTQSAKDFIAALSGRNKILPSDLVQVINGDNGGTWMHEDVAIEFARWLSPKFAIWCNDRIKELLTGKNTQPLTPAQQLLANAQLLVDMERRQSLMESRVAQIENRIQCNGFMSVMGFANIHHLNIGKKAAQAIGRLASKWCKRNGYKPEKTNHERYGEVNTYPKAALKASFAEFYPDIEF